MTATLTRPVHQLAAEELVLLRYLRDCNKWVQPDRLERAMGPRGMRFPAGDHLLRLEAANLIERRDPAPEAIKYAISDKGQKHLAAIEESSKLKKAIEGELKARIDKLATPHPRDKSVVPEEALEPYRYLMRLVLGSEQPIRLSEVPLVESPVDEDVEQEERDERDEAGPRSQGRAARQDPPETDQAPGRRAAPAARPSNRSKPPKARREAADADTRGE